MSKPTDTPNALPTDATYLTALAGLTSSPQPSSKNALAIGKHSIAVLPFVNMNRDDEGESLADGISEDIITALSRHSELFVIARTSSFAFKGQSKDIKTIAAELGVRFVLEGSVRKLGTRIRVTAQLIDGLSGSHIWAEKYDGGIEEVFDIQDRVTLAVAKSTHTELLLTDYDAKGVSAVTNPGAHEIAGRAILKVHEQTRESNAEGLALAEQAIAMAPDEPRALRALALASVSATTMGLLSPTPERHEENLRLAIKAVEASPRDEQARFALSWAYSNLTRYEEAVIQCKIALDINPNFANGYGDIGDNYVLMGRAEEAIEYAEKALRLNPLDPSFFWRRYTIALSRFILNDLEVARSQLHEIVQRHPTFLRASIAWAAAAAACDRMEEAKRAVVHCLSLAPELSMSNLVPSYFSGFARSEHQDYFLAMLRRAGLPDHPPSTDKVPSQTQGDAKG
ncbi:tetratricopeptide repeat protein [Aestuariivirga sp.]|uniref:tetratricopeptide repeat protein n=1 Tax=Aestuariivirga sp. TaxID=2650926 RepID=UPI00391CCA6A